MIKCSNKQFYENINGNKKLVNKLEENPLLHDPHLLQVVTYSNNPLIMPQKNLKLKFNFPKLNTNEAKIKTGIVLLASSTTFNTFNHTIHTLH